MESNMLVGKKVVAVWLSDDQHKIRFDLEGGEQVVAETDGDCCSYTWIEHVDGAEQLLGTVASVEDVNMPDLGDMEGHEVVSYYGCRITTDRGFATIDFRNSSNGYYGGSLCWPDKEYYYGGVWGQNQAKSPVVWKQIAGQ